MYNVLCGANEVYSANLVWQLNPFLVAFLTSLIAAIFFNTLQIKDFSGYLNKIKAHAGNVLLVNITTLFIWLSFFISLKYVEPAIVATINGAIAPISVVVLGRYLRPNSKVLGVEVFSAIGIFASLIVLIWFSLTGKSALSDRPIAGVLIGIVAALICGVAIAAHTFFCKRLNEAGWDAVSVMSARFFLLIICAFSSSMWQSDLGSFNPTNIVPFLLVVIGGMIIPLYLLQVSIKLCEPIAFSLLFALGPFFTLGLQIFDPRLSWSVHSTVGILAITVFVGISVLGRHWSLK